MLPEISRTIETVYISILFDVGPLLIDALAALSFMSTRRRSGVSSRTSVYFLRIIEASTDRYVRILAPIKGFITAPVVYQKGT